MPSHKVIQFHAPLKAVAIAGAPLPVIFTQADLDAARREGYHHGAEEASKSLERQLVEQRAELVHLQSETFAALIQQHGAMLEQLKGLVPELVMEGVARILGGLQTDRENLIRIVDDLLGELTPSGQAIEVQLHPGDLELVNGYEKDLREKFPAIAFKVGSDLQPGDAVVRSQFGVIDGRLGTKFRMVEALFQ